MTMSAPADANLGDRSAPAMMIIGSEIFCGVFIVVNLWPVGHLVNVEDSFVYDRTIVLFNNHS